MFVWLSITNVVSNTRRTSIKTIRIHAYYSTMTPQYSPPQPYNKQCEPDQSYREC